MLRRMYGLLTLLLVLVILVTAPGDAFSAATREYQIKAALLYNFLKFVDWPVDGEVKTKEPLVIGIVGGDDFAGAFEPLAEKRIGGRTVVVRQFEYPIKGGTQDPPVKFRLDDTNEMKDCHMLFLAGTQRKAAAHIVKELEGYPVLTISEMDGFLDAGGIIQLVTHDKKVRFEINNVAANQLKLTISSKLLRLAKRVVDDGAREEAQ